MFDDERVFTRSYKSQCLEARRHHAKRERKTPLHAQGYQLFKGGVPISKEVLASIDKDAQASADRIFNYGDRPGSKSDGKRKQTFWKPTEPEAKKLDAAIRGFLADKVSSTLLPRDPAILQSMPGCRVQAAHCDFSPETLRGVEDADMPLAVIVCLMPETTLKVWPYSAGLSALPSEELEKTASIRCQTVKLSPGDVLVFRADFVHAGSEYPKRNLRLHYFFDSPLVVRPPDETWAIHRRGCAELKRIIQSETLEPIHEEGASAPSKRRKKIR